MMQRPNDKPPDGIAKSESPKRIPRFYGKSFMLIQVNTTCNSQRNYPPRHESRRLFQSRRVLLSLLAMCFSLLHGIGFRIGVGISPYRDIGS